MRLQAVLVGRLPEGHGRLLCELRAAVALRLRVLPHHEIVREDLDRALALEVLFIVLAGQRIDNLAGVFLVQCLLADHDVAAVARAHGAGQHVALGALEKVLMVHAAVRLEVGAAAAAVRA